MDILYVLEEFQTLARNGLAYANNPYDRERYERLLGLTSMLYGQTLDIPPLQVRQQLAAELGHITPKIGANAAIFDQSGQILLMLRSDSSRWCLPGGWVDANESPEETVIRETREETGLNVVPAGLVDIFTRRAGINAGVHTSIGVVYLCNVVAGILQGSHESLDLRYWILNEVPIWAGEHEAWARKAYSYWKARQEEGR